ncbi:hypothetical protein EON81_02330 [bacterium]|nr:MAG: hypothetical protein EON81_02330 [bacterium]
MTASKSIVLAAALFGTLLATPATAVAPKITEKYVVKVDPNVFIPAQFTLKINGEEVGNYDSKSNIDITEFVKAGKNKFTVVYAPTGPYKNRFAATVLTIGVNRNGKWSTVMKVSATQGSPKGTRTLTIKAK